MAREEETKRKLVESLCLEINRAIISSKDVKTCIKHVKDLDYLDQVQGCNMELEIQVVLAIAPDSGR